MTWKEFKETVDRQLAEQGADESIQIEYIDISYPIVVEARVSKLDKDDPGTLSVD